MSVHPEGHRQAEPVAPEERTIFAMGGGGFTMELSNPLLDDFVLSLARAREPRILFLPTASGDTAPQINAFKARFSGRTCTAEHLSLFRLRETRRSLGEIVAEQDILYVGGGSMRNLLAIWRAHGLDALLVQAWERGAVLAGLSAGAMCWFQWGLTRSSGPPEPIEGLGLLAGSLTVHADGEPERLPVWLAHLRDGTMPGGWALDDGVGLVFHGDVLDRVVSSRPGTEALRVDAIAGELVRRRIQPELLGSRAGDPLGGYDDAVEELRRVHRLRRGTGRRRG
ncbi:MAG TPA: peptidase E [Solirubrobacteraceae bacterium]|nr:peptidase E [Solirubrobacteraceae bacterium]